MTNFDTEHFLQVDNSPKRSRTCAPNITLGTFVGVEGGGMRNWASRFYYHLLSFFFKADPVSLRFCYCKISTIKRKFALFSRPYKTHFNPSFYLYPFNIPVLFSPDSRRRCHSTLTGRSTAFTLGIPFISESQNVLLLCQSSFYHLNKSNSLKYSHGVTEKPTEALP